MSETYKTKFEVLKILRDNIFAGLESFGLPTKNTDEGNGWDCVEAEQPSFKNVDKMVAVYLDKIERVGWQGVHQEYNEETQRFEETDHWIEQQTWMIRVFKRMKTDPPSSDTLTSTDVCGMLIAWFNRLGCAEFRKHYCANLFVQMKDLKTYKGPSDVSQWTSQFPLKLQVPKLFTTSIPSAQVKYEGMIGV